MITANMSPNKPLFFDLTEDYYRKDARCKTQYVKIGWGGGEGSRLNMYDVNNFKNRFQNRHYWCYEGYMNSIVFNPSSINHHVVVYIYWSLGFQSSVLVFLQFTVDGIISSILCDVLKLSVFFISMNDVSYKCSIVNLSKAVKISLLI